MIKVRIKGVMYPIPWSAQVKDADKIINWAIGARGLEIMHDESQVFKHPTPYYETQLRTLRQSNQVLITDRGVVYGWWLEKGHKSTSFRGYHLWEHGLRRIRAEVRSIGNKKLEDMLSE